MIVEDEVIVVTHLQIHLTPTPTIIDQRIWI